jgi:CheY-like chemotaxis protein
MAKQDSGITLFVDDDEAYRLVLAVAMQTIGRADRCRALENAAQAIAYLSGAGIYSDRSTHPLPAMLFLDLEMPGGDGFGVLQWLHDHP